jgi:hypothetical protein
MEGGLRILVTAVNAAALAEPFIAANLCEARVNTLNKA